MIKRDNSLSPEEREDPILKPALKEVAKCLEEAETLLAGRRRQEAHEALERIRHLFLQVCTETGILYLPDRLTAFHDPMEAFYEKVATVKISTSPA